MASKPRADGQIPGYVVLPTGNRKWVYGRSKKQVQQRIRDLLKDLDNGFLPSGRQTVGQYLDRWIELTKKPKLGHGATRYEGLIRLHIKPRIGTKQLGLLRPLDLQCLYVDLGPSEDRDHEGLAPATILKVHNVLHGALGRTHPQRRRRRREA